MLNRPTQPNQRKNAFAITNHPIPVGPLAKCPVIFSLGGLHLSYIPGLGLHLKPPPTTLRYGTRRGPFGKTECNVSNLAKGLGRVLSSLFFLNAFPGEERVTLDVGVAEFHPIPIFEKKKKRKMKSPNSSGLSLALSCALLSRTVHST